MSFLMYQKRKLQRKNEDISKKNRNYLRLLIINMFYIQKLVNDNLFKNNHNSFLRNVLQVNGFHNSSGVFESCDWLRLGKFFRHQSTRAYFQSKAYIKIILKNHARSYYRGNTVSPSGFTLFKQGSHCWIWKSESSLVVYPILFINELRSKIYVFHHSQTGRVLFGSAALATTIWRRPFGAELFWCWDVLATASAETFV